MTQNASHETNLTTVITLMDDLIRAERYGACAAAATGSFGFSMAGLILDIEACNNQVSEMDDRGIPQSDRRRQSVGTRIKNLENRLDRHQELYNWFLAITKNEGMEDFATTNAETTLRLMQNPQVPEIPELEHHAKIVGCTLAEAKEHILKCNKEDAEAIAKVSNSIRPLLQRKFDGLKDAKTMDKLLKKFGGKQGPIVANVVELDDYEARRIIELIERKADQYANSCEDIIDRTRGRTSRQRRRKEAIAGTMYILRGLVEKAGKEADKLSDRIDTETKREGEETYDSEHGTTRAVS